MKNQHAHKACPLSTIIYFKNKLFLGTVTSKSIKHQHNIILHPVSQCGTLPGSRNHVSKKKKDESTEECSFCLCWQPRLWAAFVTCVGFFFSLCRLTGCERQSGLCISVCMHGMHVCVCVCYKQTPFTLCGPETG